MEKLRSHVIKLEKGKTADFYAEIVKKEDTTFLILFESENSNQWKFEYDCKKTWATNGSTLNSIYTVTPIQEFVLIFDNQTDRNNYMKKINAASLIKKDNDYIETLEEQLSPTVKFSMNGIY